MRDAHNKVNTAKERRLHTVSSIKMLRVDAQDESLGLPKTSGALGI